MSDPKCPKIWKQTLEEQWKKVKFLRRLWRIRWAWDDLETDTSHLTLLPRDVWLGKFSFSLYLSLHFTEIGINLVPFTVLLWVLSEIMCVKDLAKVSCLCSVNISCSYECSVSVAVAQTQYGEESFINTLISWAIRKLYKWHFKKIK